MNHYHRLNTYSQLKTAVLGSFYYPEYFDFIKNAQVRSSLQTIADETNQDLEYFEQFLVSQGVRVLRPQLPNTAFFQDYFERYQKLPTPPLQPRNNYSVIGQRLYKLSNENTYIDRCLQDYNSQDLVDLSASSQVFFSQSLETNADCCHNNTWFRRRKYLELAGPDWPLFGDYVKGAAVKDPAIAQEINSFADSLKYHATDFDQLQGPNIFPTDYGIVVDCNEYCDYAAWAQQHIDAAADYVNINTGAGHTDGCFVVLGNNTILGVEPLIDYQAHFPKHHLISVPNTSYINHVESFYKMKALVHGRWWVEGQESNLDFINFVEQYCRDWVGYVEETVFDVNVLAINESTVCVSGKNPKIEAQLAQRGISTVNIPWRHRFFVDGGLHCITLDLVRQHV
jgi:hypothetical protein